MNKDKIQRQSKWSTLHWVIAALCIIVAALVTIVAALLARPVKVVSNFEQCKSAGGVMLESYPEQCLINGTTFTNSAQSVDGNTYIGMSEADALAKAKQDNTPARVVERDGEGLPVTMDFAFGRHNLYVRDGSVYKVEIEGQATDTQQ